MVSDRIIQDGNYVMGAPRNFNIDGPDFRVTAKFDGKTDVIIQVEYSGYIGHTEFFGSGKCSWKNTLEVMANLTVHSSIPFSNSLKVWESDAGSHYSGVEDVCNKHRSLIDGNWDHAKTELEAKTHGADTFFRGRVEDFLRSKAPDVTSFEWDLA